MSICRNRTYSPSSSRVSLPRVNWEFSGLLGAPITQAMNCGAIDTADDGDYKIYVAQVNYTLCSVIYATNAQLYRFLFISAHMYWYNKIEKQSKTHVYNKKQ